jgi:hypothetical protein
MLTPLPEKSTAVLSHEGELDLMPDGPGCGAQSYVRALSERLASVILSRLLSIGVPSMFVTAARRGQFLYEEIRWRRQRRSAPGNDRPR